MDFSKPAIGSNGVVCPDTPKCRKFLMISISWRAYLIPTYIPEEFLNCTIRPDATGCGHFLLDSQGEFLYCPSPKKGSFYHFTCWGPQAYTGLTNQAPHWTSLSTVLLNF